MKSFLIGTAVGVAATLLVQQLLPGHDAAPAPAPAATTSSMEATQVSAASAPLAAAPSASAAPVAAAPAAALAQPAPVRAAPVTATATATPLPPLQLSDEHASLLNPPTVPPPLQPTPQELYARFVSEPQDPNWSFVMEQSLRAYLTSNNQQGEFDLRNVECRNTACVINAFGNQPTSQLRWHELLKGMQTQAWSSNFGGSSLTTRDLNGRTVIATILLRKAP